MSLLTPPKKTSVIKQSYQTSVVKTTYTSPARNTGISGFSNIREIPLDPKAQYTISYVPGMSEYAIETGNTFEEAKLKIVRLTCELEKVNTYNYTLVRENEVLRVQANKSEREKDLETKLAIVLAENEKLNQVIEEIYEVYMSQRGGYECQEEYERRLTDLYVELEDWKQRYHILGDQTNIVELQNQVKELQSQKDLLAEQLARKDRDLEVLRARLDSLEGTSSINSNELQQKVAVLTSENHVLTKELEAMKLKFGKADGLKLKLANYEEKIKTVLDENDKLNSLLIQKLDEIKELRARDNGKVVEFDVKLNTPQGEQTKKAGNTGNHEFAMRIQELSDENDELRMENQNLKSQLLQLGEYDARLNMVLEENHKLSMKLDEKDREIMILRANNKSAQDAVIEKLSVKIHELIAENDKLNTFANTKSKEVVILTEENRTVKVQLDQYRLEIQQLYAKFSEFNEYEKTLNEYREKVILIAQENERLNTLVLVKQEEIETLRKKLATESTKVNIESYEEKIRLYIAENQRLTDLMKDQSKELDTLRYRLYDLQSNSSQITELTVKISMLATENERLNNELSNLRLKAREDNSWELQAQVNYLTSEKSRLEALLEEKTREINYLKDNQVRVVEANFVEVNRQNETLKSAGAEQKRKINDLEGRLSQLLVLETQVNYFKIEIEQLNKDLMERETYLQMAGLRLAEKDNECEELKRRLAAAENEKLLIVEEIRVKFQAEQERMSIALKDQLENEIRRLLAEKKNLEENANYAAMEVDRVQTLIKAIRAELEEWKRKCAELESSRSSMQEIEELRIQFEGLKNINIQIKELQMKFAAERMAYETQILQLSQTINDLELTNKMLVVENERVTALSVQRLSAIEELKQNNNEDNHKLEVYELRNQLETLKSHIYDMKQLALQYSTEKAADQSKITELIQVNASYKAEIEHLSDLMEQRRADVESLTRQNEDLRRICEKLNQQSRNSITSKYETVEVLQAKVSELEMSKNEFQRQSEKHQIELTRKNRELVDKIQELDIVKLKYEEALANYQALNGQLFTRLSVKQYN